MSNVPNQQKGQSLFHQTPLKTDEDKLVNQSEIAPCCTPALKPLLSPWQLYSVLIEWMCQEISQPSCHLFRIFPLKCQFNFDVHIKQLRGFPHYALEPTSHLQDMPEMCCTKALWGSGKQWSWHSYQAMVPVLCLQKAWACEYWPWEGILSSAERRRGTSQIKAADRWDFQYDSTQSDSFTTGASLIFTNVNSHYHFPTPCIVCDTTLEVLHSVHVPLAMCRVRETGETEAKCFGSLRLQMPKSRDWHFTVVLPLGGIIQRCVACWAPAMSSSI